MGFFVKRHLKSWVVLLLSILLALSFTGVGEGLAVDDAGEDSIVGDAPEDLFGDSQKKLSYYVDLLSGVWAEKNRTITIDETTLSINSLGQLLYRENRDDITKRISGEIFLTVDKDLIFINLGPSKSGGIVVYRMRRVKQ